MSDDDDLFGSSDSGGDTDDLIANAKSAGTGKAPPATKKRLQKKPAAASKKRKLPDADNNSDNDDDLFADSEDDAPAKKQPKKPLSKREKLEALQKKKRQEQAVTNTQKTTKKTATDGSGKKNSEITEKDKGYDSGDSYESVNFQRTQADNDFIDMDDDDEEAIKELYSEQHFDDERPDGEDSDDERRRRKKGAGSAPRRRGPDAVSDDDDEDNPNPIMAAVKKMQRKKRVAKKVTELEDEGKEFIAKMDAAAEDDEQAFKAKRPATKKLAMLAEVVDMLTRRDMMRLLLDLDVLAACKKWIKPLPNGQLGNVTVRQRVIESVANMNGENGITSNDLKRSGIGQTIMILYKHKSETPNMKRELKKLIEQWSRPIFQKSGNMRDLEHAHSTRRGDPNSLSSIHASRPATQPTGPAPSRGRGNEKDLHSLIASGKTGPQKEGLNRVRVPYSKGFQFTVRPQSKTGNVADKRMIRGGPAKDNRGNLSKRMTEKGRASSKNQRSANLSIEGRPTK